MNLIKRTLLIVLAAAALAQPAYSMDVAIITRFIEFIRPHAAKVGWYSVNQAGWFLIGNGPIIAISTSLAYIGIRKFLSGELGALRRQVGEVGGKVIVVEKKVDDANRKLDNIGNKQDEHRVVLNTLQDGQNKHGEQLQTIDDNVNNIKIGQQQQGEKLEYLTKGHAENQEALLDLLHGQENIEAGLKIFDKKIDEITITLNNDRAKKEDQEKAFNDLIIQQTELYKAVDQLQKDGKLQNNDVVFKIAALDDKIDKVQDSYITRMDRIEAQIKKNKEESDKRFEEQSEQLRNQAQLLEEQKRQISDLREEYAVLRKELKDRDDKLMTFLENNKQDLNASFTRLREDIDRDNKTNIAVAVASVRNSNVRGLPSPRISTVGERNEQSPIILGKGPNLLNTTTQRSSMWNLQQQMNTNILTIN